LEGTVRATHQLEREQTESISSAISSLQSKVEETRAVELRYMSGALLVASIVAAIRLRGDEIKPSPKLNAVIHDSLLLARSILARMDRG
jgi:hypothetical protein